MLVRLSIACGGVRGDKILRTNRGEEFAVFERDVVCCTPNPTNLLATSRNIKHYHCFLSSL